ncbi:MAG: cell division protein ZapB [Deltaproteobacteria bacterium]|nr:cell division protein ZapB [Deltaproteobacteria bacterium]
MDWRVSCMALEQFERLEIGVEQVLKRCEELRAENARLKDAIEAKGAEVEDLKAKLKRLDREKVQVKEKVDTLLTRLDGLIQSA